MIKGIGIDMVEIKRIQRAMEKNERFVYRILTASELELYHTLESMHRKVEFVAGRFAAKEALGKAMGTGIGSCFSFQDIAVSRGEHGKPMMDVKGCEEKIWVSISHSQSHAIAQVIVEI